MAGTQADQTPGGKPATNAGPSRSTTLPSRSRPRPRPTAQPSQPQSANPTLKPAERVEKGKQASSSPSTAKAERVPVSPSREFQFPTRLEPKTAPLLHFNTEPRDAEDKVSRKKVSFPERQVNKELVRVQRLTREFEESTQEVINSFIAWLSAPNPSPKPNPTPTPTPKPKLKQNPPRFTFTSSIPFPTEPTTPATFSLSPYPAPDPESKYGRKVRLLSKAWQQQEIYDPRMSAHQEAALELDLVRFFSKDQIKSTYARALAKKENGKMTADDEMEVRCELAHMHWISVIKAHEKHFSDSKAETGVGGVKINRRMVDVLPKTMLPSYEYLGDVFPKWDRDLVYELGMMVPLVGSWTELGWRVSVKARARKLAEGKHDPLAMMMASDVEAARLELTRAGADVRKI